MFAAHLPVGITNDQDAFLFQVLYATDNQLFLVFFRKIVKHICQNESPAFWKGHLNGISINKFQPFIFRRTVSGNLNFFPVIINAGNSPSFG